MVIKNLNKEPEVSVGPVVELINNIIFLAAAYNQIWTLKAIEIEGESYAAFVDERSEQVKTLFLNPDPMMKEIVSQLKEKDWYKIRQEVLSNPEKFNSGRVQLIEKE